MDELAGIYAREAPSIDSYVQIGVASSKVVQLSFPATPDEGAEAEHDLLDRILDYLEGATEEEFEDVTVALTVPTEQRSVLKSLQSVPYGRSVSVEQLVRMTAGLAPDEEESQRTVRTAIGANPAPILIPDHRVRDASGATPHEIAAHLRSIEGIEL